MAELKQSRWVKIHEPGQADCDEKDNVMDIMIGSNRCQAEVTYTVRSYRKAAGWLLKYLECADAVQILALAAEQIQAEAAAAGRDDSAVTANGDNWSCEIEKMEQGVYKVRMSWLTETQATKKPKRRSKKKVETVA